jgi:hypothetical protein
LVSSSLAYRMAARPTAAEPRAIRERLAHKAIETGRRISFPLQELRVLFERRSLADTATAPEGEAASATTQPLALAQVPPIPTLSEWNQP